MRTASVVTVDESGEMVGVRFRPGGALPFVASSLEELTGRRVALPLLWGDLAQQMGNAVRTAAPGERIAALEVYLRGRMQQQQSVASRRRTTMVREAVLVSRAVTQLGHDSAARVRDVAAALGIDARSLERMFNRTVGVPPKVFSRMRRCCEAARLIRRTCGAHANKPAERSVVRCNWSAIGAATGYADQAHFIREFRALTGVTPATYAAEDHPVGFMQYDRSRAS
jgi:AraC-like DNA-binding protein